MSSNGNNDKYQRILSVAIRIFAEHGYERVKVNDITEGAGIAKGTFYLYFKTKQELLLECFSQLELMIARLENSKIVRGENDFFIRMKNRWIAFNEYYTEIGRLLHLIRNECNSIDPLIREKARKSYNSFITPLSSDIAISIKRKEVREIDPELGAYLIVGIAESFAFRVNSEISCKGDPNEIFFNAIRDIFKPIKE